jgi:hypothetical protein
MIRRRLVTVTHVLLLLLGLAMLFMWVRSYHRADGVQRELFDQPDDDLPISVPVIITSANGAVAVNVDASVYPGVESARANHPLTVRWQVVGSPAEQWRTDFESFLSQMSRMTSIGVVHLGFLGFGYYRVRYIDQWDMYVVAVPYWALAMLTLLPPTLWIRRCVVRRHRASRNRCVTCGYDLRASTDRCPECGTPIPANVGTPA